MSFMVSVLDCRASIPDRWLEEAGGLRLVGGVNSVDYAATAAGEAAQPWARQNLQCDS